MNENTSEKKSIAEMLKHPLANVIVGFVLTGVLGTSITQYYLVLREKQSAQYELAQTRKESIAALATLNAEYLAHAERVLATVDRGNKAAAKEHMQKFDDAALRWQVEKPPVLLSTRDVLPEALYLQFRDQINARFRDQFLVPFGTCVSNAVDELAAGRDAAAVTKACRAREYLVQAKACSRDLLDMLHVLSGYTVEGDSGELLLINRDKYSAALQQACSMD